MGRVKEKKYILYDPVHHIKQELTYDQIVGITGLSKSNVMRAKSKQSRIQCLGAYIFDLDADKKLMNELYRAEVIPDESWKRIDFADHEMYASNYGRIKRVFKNSERILIPFKKHGKPVFAIKITVGGKVKEMLVHQIIAHVWIGPAKKGMTVWHKDENRAINEAWNLEYITKSEMGYRTAHLAQAIPVQQICPDTGEVVNEFRSVTQAGKAVYISHGQAICDCLNGKQKTSAGYIWKKIDASEVAMAI